MTVTEQERTFEEDYSEGPVYVQEWLTGRSDFRKVYAGPYDGKGLDAIRTPFLTAVVDSETHWLQRPIVPNQLADGVDLFGGPP